MILFMVYRKYEDKSIFIYTCLTSYLRYITPMARSL